MIFIAFLMVIAGLVGAISPFAAWYVSTGCQFRDAEPSEMALVMHNGYSTIWK